MSVNILMPALSPTMEEGTLARWLVKEGDRISSGDLIAEIETDKATMEFEAVDEGIVGKLLVSEGSEGVKVNSPIAIILDDGEQLEASETTNLTVQEEPKTNSTEEAIVQVEQISTNIAKTYSKRIFATPLAKRLAKEKGLNLGTARGQLRVHGDHPIELGRPRTETERLLRGEQRADWIHPSFHGGNPGDDPTLGEPSHWRYSKQFGVAAQPQAIVPSG